MFLEKLSRDLAAAMKSREEGRELRLSVLRMMKSALKNAEIAKRGEGALTEEDIIGVITSMVKQRRDSAEQYEKAGRKDLANKENGEIEILQEYLPRQLMPEELDEIIKAAINETGAAGVKDMGKLMKALMPQVKGRADGKLVNQRVKDLLEQKS